MTFTDTEAALIISDPTKLITGDIKWQVDGDHPTWVEFRVDVENASGVPLIVTGSCNLAIPAVRFCLIHRGVGRIYGLCYGTNHHNPSCDTIGEKHKHRWTEAFKDKEAYVPPDITAPVSDVCLVWRQFCAEAFIQHDGNLQPPPPLQEDLF